MKIEGNKNLAERWAQQTSNAVPAYEQGRLNPVRGEPTLEAGAGIKYARSAKPARSAWARGWAPYREVLRKLKLPARGKTRSKANARRCMLVCQALSREKLRRAAKRGKKPPRTKEAK